VLAPRGFGGGEGGGGGGSPPQHAYLVTELMETDLHRVVHSRQDLTSDHISYFIYQTLCALRHIHAAHILHRDLKPANLLVNADCSLKMCDFGLARESDTTLSQNLTEYVVTRCGRVARARRSSRVIDFTMMMCSVAAAHVPCRDMGVIHTAHGWGRRVSVLRPPSALDCKANTRSC
jgi:serine/threonine protein kinase